MPTQAQLQIGEGAPIAIAADLIKLTEQQNPLEPIPQVMRFAGACGHAFEVPTPKK